MTEKKTTKAFNSGSKLPHWVTIPVGDWSGDGHEKCVHMHYRASHPVDEIRDAYLKSVKLMDISFDWHNGHNRGFNKGGASIEIATEYGDAGLSAEAQAKLVSHGFDLKRIADPERMTPQELGDLILWFAGRSLNNFSYAARKTAPKETERLNGYWNKKLNVQFGYGLFDD